MFGDFGGGDLPNADGLAVQIFAIAENGLKTVADGVPKIQYGPQTGFSFIFSDHLRLDLATPRNDRRECGRIMRKKLGQVALKTRE